MAARHRKKHHKGVGGKIDGADVAAGNEEVFKEAEGKRRKRGGTVVAHRMAGGPVKHRLDRPGRKRGGRVGADTSPLTSAHHSTKEQSAPRSTVGPTEDREDD